VFENSCLKFGLNTYVYAPKDDDKHRSRWRDLYDQHEADQLSTLIRSCHASSLKFIYALSPGLDIKYSSDEDRHLLRRKFQQVSTVSSSFSFIDVTQIEFSSAESDGLSTLGLVIRRY
jgi:hypothetical protein